MTNPHLFVVVAFQVTVFQMMYPLLSRSVTGLQVGSTNLPPDVGRELEALRRKATRESRWAGGVLLIAAMVGATWTLSDPVPKLWLALTSLASSGVFLFRFVRDGRATRELSRKLPDTDVRTASLRPRSFVPPLWEVLPVAIFAATVAFTLWVAGEGVGHGSLAASGEGALSSGFLWLLPVGQAAVLVLAHLAGRKIAHAPAVPQRSRPFHGSPGLAVKRDHEARLRELKALFFAKSIIVLILGTAQTGRGIQLLTGSVAGWPSAMTWGGVGLLMAVFAWYVRASSRLGRGAAS